MGGREIPDKQRKRGGLRLRGINEEENDKEREREREREKIKGEFSRIRIDNV